MALPNTLNANNVGTGGQQVANGGALYNPLASNHQMPVSTLGALRPVPAPFNPATPATVAPATAALPISTNSLGLPTSGFAPNVAINSPGTGVGAGVTGGTSG